jgi:hypothetical protein
LLDVKGTARATGGLFTGNVGINSAAPGQWLDVQGTVSTTGFLLSTNPAAGSVLVSTSVGVGTWMPQSTLPLGTLNSGTINQFAYYSGSTTLSASNTLIFDGTNIGISTAGPSNKLDIVGNIGIGTVGNGDNFLTTAAPNGGMLVEGNVGLGSLAPGQVLDVQGTVRDVGEIINGNVGIGTSALQTVFAVTNGNVGIGTWTADGGSLIVNSGKNVGISSAWPGFLLDVNGTIRTSSGAVRFSDGTQMTSANARTYQATPADPVSFNGNGMAGLAGSFTPQKSGNVLIVISGYMYNSSGSTTSQAQIRYGTGGAPANGAALTGTTAGSNIEALDSATSRRFPFSCNAVVTGLTIYTTYWLDLGLTSGSGTTQVRVFQVSISAVEV